MYVPPSSTEAVSSSESSADGGWPEPVAWRVVDEEVALAFVDVTAGARPRSLRWRGSLWRVIGPGRHWTTWHSFAIEPANDVSPVSRGVRTSFWRFAGQTNPVAPVFHFEVRGEGNDWRLVRLGAVFDLPPSS